MAPNMDQSLAPGSERLTIRTFLTGSSLCLRVSAEGPLHWSFFFSWLVRYLGARDMARTKAARRR